MKHLLEETKYFTFEKEEEINGIKYELYLDDYGQSYVIAYKDPIDGEIIEIGCGTYNDYQDTLDYCVKKNKKRGKEFIL